MTLVRREGTRASPRKTHRTQLLHQLDAIERQVAARAETARDELASREIIAVRPAKGAELTPDQLDDARADARLVGFVPETGIVLLDVATSTLEHIREKVDAFADDEAASAAISVEV